MARKKKINNNTFTFAGHTFRILTPEEQIERSKEERAKKFIKELRDDPFAKIVHDPWKGTYVEHTTMYKLFHHDDNCIDDDQPILFKSKKGKYPYGKDNKSIRK
jgi:hypothetical protein